MSDYSAYNWFAKILSAKNINSAELKQIIAKYGIQHDARHIGALREEFKKFVSPDFWRIMLKRGELIRENLDKTVSVGNAENYMFPMMQEEYSFDLDFLRYAFPLPTFPVLNDLNSCKVVTIGSCFAANIAKSLSRNGVMSSTCAFPEDINSPIALLSLLTVLDGIDDFVCQMYKRFDRIIEKNPKSGDLSSVNAYLGIEKKRMQDLSRDLRDADCVIVTFGNILEWDTSVRLLLKNEVDAAIALNAFNYNHSGVPGLWYSGDYRRPASLSIVSMSIKQTLHKLKSLTDGFIICTVSPIPIRGISGKNIESSHSAITENNLSKSCLRSALNEVIADSRIEGVYYFPSFEIATDVALRVPTVGFGNDDSNSRHLDEQVIDSICRFFVFKMFPLSRN